MQKNSAVYAISHRTSGKAYIGSSKRLRTRIVEHRRELRHGTHWNVHLQRAWKKYGAAAFDFKVLEFCPPDRLLEREQFWIDQK